MYRNSLPLRGTESISAQQVQELLETAITECEKIFQAFQYVMWGGKEPPEAREASIAELVGEA